MLIELLQKYVNQPLVINQLQFGVAHTPMLDQELFFNMTADQSVDRSSEILEYCRLKDIAIQAWSPFQYGFFEGVYLDNAKFGPLNDTLDAIGRKYGVSKAAVGRCLDSAPSGENPGNRRHHQPGAPEGDVQGSEVVLTREDGMRFTGRPDIKSPDHKPPFRGLSRSEANKYSGCLAVLFYGS